MQESNILLCASGFSSRQGAVRDRLLDTHTELEQALSFQVGDSSLDEAESTLANPTSLPQEAASQFLVQESLQ